MLQVLAFGDVEPVARMKRTEGYLGAASWLQMWMTRHRSDALSGSKIEAVAVDHCIQQSLWSTVSEETLFPK